MVIWRTSTADEFEQRFARHLPETMTGAEFLARYGGTSDSVTKVEPDRTYAIRAPARHPIYENFRVRRFAELLQRPGKLSQNEKITLGKLMYESHAELFRVRARFTSH